MATERAWWIFDGQTMRAVDATDFQGVALKRPLWKIGQACEALVPCPGEPNVCEPCGEPAVEVVERKGVCHAHAADYHEWKAEKAAELEAWNARVAEIAAQHQPAPEAAA